MVVMREAIGGEPFFRSGSSAALSIKIPSIPVKSMLRRIPGMIPSRILTTKTIAISAPKAYTEPCEKLTSLRIPNTSE